MNDDRKLRSHGPHGAVTGAARGLGRAIALALADAGADVALGLRDKAADGGLVAEIEAKGRRALPLQMDVHRPGQGYAAIDAAIAAFGKLDILVNNAGGGVDERPVEVYTEADFDFVLDLNVKSTFFFTQHAGKHMMARGSGAIVNMGSQAGAIALPGEARLLPQQGGGVAHDQVLCGRVGQAQRRRQLRGADLHRDRRHRRHAGATRRSTPT